MEIKAETHTHTNACAHAYNSIQEMICGAKERGKELIAITDHAPAMPDAPHEYHFLNMRVLPRKIDGIYVLRGAEVNILDMEGRIDLDDDILRRLDVVIASMHGPCLTPGTVEEHTNAYLKVLQNPYVDILGHSGSPQYRYDIDRVLSEAKRLDKLIEINNQSFVVRKENVPICLEIAKRCRELGVKVVVGTDAHCVYGIGQTEKAMQIIKEADVPEELVMNTTAEKFLNYLCHRKGLQREMFESEYPDGLAPSAEQTTRI